MVGLATFFFNPVTFFLLKCVY